MMNIGIILLGVNDEACGGAERFFADFFDLYNHQRQPQYNLFFITDKYSLQVFRKLGKLKHASKIILVKEISNRFKITIEKYDFALQCILHKLNLLHIASYGRHYYPRIKFIDSFPVFRPKIVLNIVDAELSHVLLEKTGPKYQEYMNRYGAIFNTIHIDGIYTWYEHFKFNAEKFHWIKSNPYIEAIKTRFSAMALRINASTTKNQEFVYAARLIERKRPELFVDAINILRTKIPTDIWSQWKFKIYGVGPLETKLKNKIRDFNLEQNVRMGFTPDLSEILSKSKCFVSTMDFENFPSQAMNEAMAAGNAIIARNVGQTHLFVQDKKNGILINDDSPESLANAMQFYIQHPELHESMKNESIRLTREVHTQENFFQQIEKFWDKVLQKK